MKGGMLRLFIAGEEGERDRAQGGSETQWSMVGEKQDKDMTGHAIKRIKQGTSDVTAFYVMQQALNALKTFEAEELRKRTRLTSGASQTQVNRSVKGVVFNRKGGLCKKDQRS